MTINSNIYVLYLIKPLIFDNCTLKSVAMVSYFFDTASTFPPNSSSCILCCFWQSFHLSYGNFRCFPVSKWNSNFLSSYCFWKFSRTEEKTLTSLQPLIYFLILIILIHLTLCIPYELLIIFSAFIFKKCLLSLLYNLLFCAFRFTAFQNFECMLLKLK